MPMDIKLGMELHANQQHIQDNAKKFNVIKAGKRFGKTKLALFRSLQKAGRLPGGVVWSVAPTYKQAKQIAWWELLAILPPQLIRRKIETELFIELWNECRLQLIGADNEDNLRGPKLDHVVMDEAAYCKPHIWPAILSGQLLGGSKSGTADFISSPNKDGVNWFTGFHADAKARMEAGDPEWAAFYYTIYDNPTIPVAEIEKIKAQVPDDIWELEYMAKESALSGLWFPEFDYKKHVGVYEIPMA